MAKAFAGLRVRRALRALAPLALRNLAPLVLQSLAPLARRTLAPLTLPVLAALALASLGACETPPPSFALVAEPAALTLSAGGPVELLTIRLTPEPGFDGEVELEVTDVPPGVTAKLSSATVALGRSASLELAAEATAAPVTRATLRLEGRSTSPLTRAVVEVAITVEEATPAEPSTPPNDTFDEAAPLEGRSGTVTASNVGASTEPGEPRHAGVDGGRSLWWRWRATESGLVTFDTHGSAIPTGLAVYQGDAVDALSAVAHDAAGVGDAGGTAHAFVDIIAVAGTTYRIAVDGNDGAEGEIVLNWAAAGAMGWTADPEALQFDGTVGGEAPASQAFELRTDALTTAPFTVRATEPWIEVSPAAGTWSGARGGLAIDVRVGACETPATEAGTVTIVGRGGTLLVPVRRLCAPLPETLHLLQIEGANGRVAVDGAPLVLPWTGTVPDATSVALEALPFDGYRFERWEGAVSGSENPIGLFITADMAVTAVFVPAPTSTVPLTVAVAGAGTVTSRPAGIDCGERCEAHFDAGITVVLEAEALPGSVFAGWSGACSGRGECALTMRAPLEVEAFFERLPVITVTPGDLDFGEIIVGDTVTADFTVRNDGGGLLEGGASVASPFSIEGDAWYALAAGESASVTVAFRPIETGTVSREVRFTGAGGATGIARGESRIRPHVLAVDRIYVNQSVPAQDTLAPPAERIPLIANRAGLVRAFVSADRPGAEGAEVVLHYRSTEDEDPTSVTLMGPGTLPTEADEGHFEDSFSLLLDAELIRPGLAAHVSVTAFSEGEPIWTRYPDAGYWDIDVVTVPTLDLKLVPVTYQERTPDLGSGRVYLEQTQRMFAFPDDGIEIEIGAPYGFDGDLSTRDGWTQLAQAMWFLRLSDPARPHYYALVDAWSTPVAGVGYVGHPVAAGITRMPQSPYTVAHELGHNFGRLHAPCGGPDHLDPHYPYPGGLIGVWGYDLVDGRLQPPHSPDLMSYCWPKWVSDYTYRGVMEFRGTVAPATARGGMGAEPPAAATVAPAAAAEPVTSEPLLVVSGQVGVDGLRLDPLFVVEAPPLPFEAGPYRLIAWDAAGTTIVDVAFDTVPVSLHDQPEAILLAVPLGRPLTTRLGGVRIEERGRVLIDRRPVLSTFAAQPPQATRLPDGRVRVTWDRAAFAAALVFDGVSGLLLARDASGEVVVTPSGESLELLLSDGLNTSRTRLAF